MSYLLHPPLLDELGLVYAVRDYADGFSKRAGIEVQLDLPEKLERLSQEAETALFRVIQEALTNIHRHAGSPSAKIRLDCSPDTVVIEVEDEGRGIPTEILSSDGKTLSRMGVGMRGMEERLRQLGGRLTIDSSPRGTVVRGELPRAAANVIGYDRQDGGGAVERRSEESKRERAPGGSDCHRGSGPSASTGPRPTPRHIMPLDTRRPRR